MSRGFTQMDENESGVIEHGRLKRVFSFTEATMFLLSVLD